MTFGEKLSRLRKENNYTQEQLAEILEVSRQAVSKWEQDIAYPETDKLVRIGNLFGCSMDYLLKDGAESKNSAETGRKNTISDVIRHLFRERKSQRTLWGMPLYHISKNAYGFFALGLRARGVFSLGLLSMGVVSGGLLSLGILSMGILVAGLLSLGCFAVGVLAAGAIAFGLIAAGAIAIGVLAFGALSVGYYAVGALAIGKLAAIGDYAKGAIAIGKTEAAGHIYTFVGNMVDADLVFVRGWLAEHTPKWLDFAWKIFDVLLP